jgi:hypothetical protein
MFPAGFEPAIPASKHSQTHVLDRAATGIGTELDGLRIKVCDYGPGLHPIGDNLLGTQSPSAPSETQTVRSRIYRKWPESQFNDY